VSFSPDWRTIAVGSGDNNVVLWNFALDDLLVRACDIVGDYLKTNPNSSDNDRELCDEVTKDNEEITSTFPIKLLFASISTTSKIGFYF
jgi:hypothetical protein